MARRYRKQRKTGPRKYKRYGKRRPKNNKRGEKVFYFKRKYHTQLTVSTVNINGGFTWSLDQLNDYTEFTSLFDLYQIQMLKVNIIPTKTINTVTQTGSGGTVTSSSYVMPTVYTAIDYNDSAATTLNDLMEYSTLKVTRGGKIHSRYFRPKVACRLYAGVTDGYSYKNAQWIGTSTANGDDAVPHYGLKYYFELPAGQIADSISYKVITTFYMKFKNVV